MVAIIRASLKEKMDATIYKEKEGAKIVVLSHDSKIIDEKLTAEIL
jgi:hypothetical protein